MIKLVNLWIFYVSEWSKCWPRCDHMNKYPRIGINVGNAIDNIWIWIEFVWRWKKKSNIVLNLRREKITDWMLFIHIRMIRQKNINEQIFHEAKSTKNDVKRTCSIQYVSITCVYWFFSINQQLDDSKHFHLNNYLKLLLFVQCKKLHSIYLLVF